MKKTTIDLNYIWKNAENKLNKRWVIAYLCEIGKLGKRLYKINPNEEFRIILLKLYEQIEDLERAV